MRSLVVTTKFKKDLKKIKKQNKKIDKLTNIIEKLQKDEVLPESNCDHYLSGNWNGFRECHITPDWLLIYRKKDSEIHLLELVRTGSHSELF